MRSRGRDTWKADQERDAPWLARLLELAAQRGEQLVALTPNTVVPATLAREWFTGMRPLPGQNEDFFFSNVVKMVGPQLAAEWRERHVRLRAQEMGVASGLDLPPGLAAALVGAGWKPPTARPSPAVDPQPKEDRSG